MKKLVVLTGAGISAESGISTFRDSNGLWEGHDVMEVASPQGWAKNPALVQDFYNKRRRQLHQVQPNRGHEILAELQEHLQVHIITQNVDNLHERAGSRNVIHLHGELFKVRSTQDDNDVRHWEGDLTENDRDANGFPLRPHIVWFGEAVPQMEPAIELAMQADIFAVAGTSMQVYPAAGLIDFAPGHAPIFYVDPKPATLYLPGKRLTVIAEPASTGLEAMRAAILRMLQ